MLRSSDMPTETLLRSALERIANRQRRLLLWCQFGASWAMAGLAGVILLIIQRQAGWTSALTLPIVALLGIGLALAAAIRHRRSKPDLRELARKIEARHPDLEGRLLTAVQQQPKADGQLDYLQQRLVDEALLHNQRTDWGALVP